MRDEAVVGARQVEQPRTIVPAGPGWLPNPIAPPARAAGRSLLPRADGSPPEVVPGLTSIIVPCWNQQEFTRMCIPALVRHTAPPWELIAINNG